MSHPTSDELIRIASDVLHPHTVGERLFGDVGAALLSEAGHLYVGVSVDTPGWGLCAERSAIAAMITAGQYRMSKIVAVWKDRRTGDLHILPPCGICREFMRSVDEANLEAEIIVGRSKSVKLKDLLPLYSWPAPLDP